MFLNLLSIVSAVVLVFSLSFLLYYKLTFDSSASFSGGKTEVAVKDVSNSSEGSLSVNSENETVPLEVLSQVENLSSVITSYFVKVKNGLAVYPALVFKVVPASQGLNVFLLTFYPMEWPFVKVQLPGEELGAPERVYQCGEGLLLLNYNLKGVFPVEVERGEVEEFGAIAVRAGKDITVRLFEREKGCTDNGFVFNLAGDFSGVCFGGNFYSAEELYNSVPSNCKIIFEKEGESGNLQGKD